MLPDNTLSSTTLYAPFFAQVATKRLVDYELGSVALNDPSGGLDVQLWTARYVGGQIVVYDAANTPAFALTAAGVTKLSLAFDSNMKPTITYETADGGFLYWFDSVANANVVTPYPEIRNPAVTLDERREAFSQNSDVIFAYQKAAGGLYYRQQRDRFQTERLLQADTGDAKLLAVGMNKNYRLQFKFTGIVPQPIPLPPGPANFQEEIMFDEPLFYMRLGEDSGAVAENEASAIEGSYVGSITYAQPALRTGGDTSVRLVNSVSSVNWPNSGVPASMTAITLGIIVKATGGVSGITQLVTRDSDSGARSWQWRVNGPNMELIKIAGGVQVLTAAHGIVSGDVALLEATIDAAGAAVVYKNGVQIGAGSFAAADYGGSGQNIQLGQRGTNEGSALFFMSDAFLIPTALPLARIQAHAAKFTPA